MKAEISGKRTKPNALRSVNDDSCPDKETICVWHLMMKLDWGAQRNEPKIAKVLDCICKWEGGGESQILNSDWTKFNLLQVGHPSTKSDFPIGLLQFRSVSYFAFQ